MFGYNCARGKCDLFKTERPSKLGWIGEQVKISYSMILYKLQVKSTGNIYDFNLNKNHDSRCRILC